MSQLNERGARSERGSALWGTGGRGGDRSSVLWGKGGRGMLVASIAAIALAAPLAATASPSHKDPAPARTAIAAHAKKAPAKATHKTAAKASKKAAVKVKAKATKKAKAPAKKPVKKTPVKKTPVKKTPAKKVPAKTPVVPTAPVATPAPAPTPAPPVAASGDSPATWVDQSLLNQVASTPEQMVDVIITSSGGTTGAQAAYDWLAKVGGKHDVTGGQNLSLIGAITATIPARLLPDLQKVQGIFVTPDAPVRLADETMSLASTQQWPYESGSALQWLGDTTTYAGQVPAIAVVDSGIQQNRSDFGDRLVASVDLSTIDGNTSTDDQRGHGTFVAGIAAGSAPDLTGAAPTAPLVSVKVMDENGQAKTSDVINACQWILDNKTQYNIKVANFSLHSSYGTNSYRDPLDQAVEKLWFNGVTVVAAAGNYGTGTTPSGVLYAPGNDPFVITVGAVDIGGTIDSSDDTIAPWSAYGYTEDGFFKPEISAPGRYMVGPVPSDSTMAAARPDSLVGTDRMQLSGTSFSAPVVSGTVADMLARHPDWGPDQIKGALMRTARVIDNNGNHQAAGLGELTASRAVMSDEAPNPNAALDQFVSTPDGADSPVFDAMSWASAASTDMSWADMSWADMSWADMSWADQSWSDMSWADMSWADMSWADMSWADMSWADMSWADMANEDAVLGDNLAGADGYVATPGSVVAAATDPDTAITVDGVDPATALGVTVTPPAPPADPPAAPADPPADPPADGGGN